MSDDNSDQQAASPPAAHKGRAKSTLAAQNAEVERDRRGEARARAKFLGELTEILAHFSKPSASATSSGRRKSGPGTPNRRQRMREAEEDAQLLQEAQADAAAEHVPAHVSASPPWIANGTMRDYQIDGLNWMLQLYESSVNGVLADEMGLGKTLQTISLLGYLKNVLGLSGPHVVIVPNSTLANWQKEFARWCPSLRTFIFHGDKEKRAALKGETLVAGEFDVCITSYEMVLRELTALNKFSWRYLIIDEAHRIKNESSKLSEAVRHLRANHRLLLTGTPLQNNLHELWALLNFLMPDLFESSSAFDEWFKDAGDGSVSQDTVARLHKILKPFLLRRVKADVEKALLPKKEVKIFVGLSALQKDLYKKMLLKDIEAVNGAAAGSSGRLRLLNIAMQLRKVCNHPYLFDGVEPGPPFVEGEHLVQAAGKLQVLDKLLRKLQANGSRVLVFSQMTRMLDILEDFLVLRGYDFCRIDGSSAQEDRELEIEAYNEPGSKKFVFLLSTRAGGLGINLATADTVVLFDSDWNPQMDLQAMDRAHRIGQKKQVMVYRLVVGDTIEQKIVERAEAKLYLDALVIQQGRLVEKHANASSNELLQMVKFGADTIFQGGESDYQITDADIDDIIALGQKKTDEFSEKLKNSTLSLANFTADGLSNNLYEHDGKDFSALQRQQKKEQLLSWIAPPKRETRVATYSESAYFNKALNPNAKPRTKRAGAPSRHPKQPAVYPWHFLSPRLADLFAQETARYQAEYHMRGVEERLKEARAKDADVGELEQELAQAEHELPPALSESQEAEKEKLLAASFVEWKRPEFQAFVRGMELHGRDAIKEIATEVGFDVAEVKRYHDAFWKNAKTALPDFDKVVQRIERGAARRQKQSHVISLLKRTFADYTDPMRQVTLAQLIGATSSSTWTPENDLWLLVNTNTVGYGNWSRLRRHISADPLFALDWWMQSRTPADLKERVDLLLKRLDRTNKEAAPPAAVSLAAAAAPTKKKSTSKSRGGGADAASDAPAASASKRAAGGPKKAKTAYQFFQADRRGLVKESKPELGAAAVNQELAGQWKLVDAETRKRFEKMATDDVARYQREKAAWDAAHPDVPAAKAPPSAKKAKVATDAPKKPSSGYMMYCKEQRESVRTANPGIAVAQVTKHLAESWKSLSEVEKSVWTAKAFEAKEQWRKDLAVWRKANPAAAAALDQAERDKKAASAQKRRKVDAEQPQLETMLSAVAKKKAPAKKQESKPASRKRGQRPEQEEEEEKQADKGKAALKKAKEQEQEEEEEEEEQSE